MTEVMLKRGYSITVNDECTDIDPKVDIIGNYSKSGYMATAIVNRYGIAPTVRENHGQVTAVIEEVD